MMKQFLIKVLHKLGIQNRHAYRPDFACDLRTVKNTRELVTHINQYNYRRSIEAGKPIFDSNRVLLFHYALEKIGSLSEGHYAEVGTYRGMTAAMIWKNMEPNTELHCFDTFEGFDIRDLEAESKPLDISNEKSKFQNTTLDWVRSYITSEARDSQNLVLIKGWFPSSAKSYSHFYYRFVHLDVDLEEPIREGLNFFWPRLVSGGIILIHDYLSPQYPGVKLAVDSFCEANCLPVFPWCDRLGTALILKSPLREI